jgi:hypothetical protein
VIYDKMAEGFRTYNQRGNMRQSFPSANGKNVIDEIATKRKRTNLIVTRENDQQIPFETWAKLWVMKYVDGIPVQGI